MYLPDKNLMPTVAPDAPAPFTLESLIAWLETKDPEIRYDYEAPDECAICLYLRDVANFKEPRVCPTTYRDGARAERNRLPPGWNSIVIYEPWTLGAALTRARAYQAGAK